MNTEVKTNASKGKGSKRSSLKRQQLAIRLCLVLVILLGIAAGIVVYFTGLNVYEDIDGAKYYIEKGSDGVTYVVVDEDDQVLTLNSNGYYVTKAGSLLNLDDETGTYAVVAVVDVEDGEALSVGSTNRVMMYPQYERANIQSIQVFNEYGGYHFFRDESGDFIIEEAPETAFDAEIFSSLVVTTGYTICSGYNSNGISGGKILDPRQDPDGGYSEYGLAKGKDAEGNTIYGSGTYWVLTSLTGDIMKVYVGNRLPNGSGYYCLYESVENGVSTVRDRIYILGNTLEETILQPITNMVAPLIIYPMTSNDYYDVQNFYLYKGQKEVVSFSYVDLDERENTILSGVPYVMGKKLSEYTPDGDSINEALNDFYDMNFLGVCELAPSGATKMEYNVHEKNAPYQIYFEFDAVYEDETGASNTQTMRYNLYFSENESGNYYCYSDYSNMIVEVDASSLTFLGWELTDWVDESVIESHIAYMTDLEIETAEGTIRYELDNSSSDQSQGTSADDMTVYMTTDFKNGTPNFSDEIPSIDSFRNFYQTLLYASLEGTLPEEARTEAGQQKNWISTVTYTLNDGVNPERTIELKFYRYTSRKAYMTLNGQGAFYMLTDRVNKFWSDSIKVMNGEAVDPTAKQ